MLNVNLENKISLITGGGAGLGKTICRIFAEKGSDIIVCDIDFDAAQKMADEVNAIGRNAVPIKMDVSDGESVESGCAIALNYFPRIDVWINNAGIGSRAMLDEMTEEQWDRVLDVNLKGVFLGTREAARVMKAQKSGRIINMSSRAGKGGSYGHINYASSKAGIVGLTKSAARELGKYNITVNALQPGFIETELTKHLSDDIKKSKQIVLNRPGKPEDVAFAASFLASNEAEWITGICLEVTGGTGMFAG